MPSEAVVVRPGEAWLAFQWLDGTRDGIFLARPDGTGLHQLTPDLVGSEIHPDWSPDGQRIAFVHVTASDISELYVVNADGSEREMLLSCDAPCQSFSHPDWDAGGGSVYFGQDADTIVRFELATGEATAVLTRPDGIEQPRLSPDGGRVVYTRFRDPANAFAGSAIFVSDLSGGVEQQLTEWDTYFAYPDWSVNDLIVFNTFDLDAFPDTTTAANLYTIRPDGTGIRRLTDHGENDTRATQPRWAADGNGVVYTRVEGAAFGVRTAAFLGIEGEDPWEGLDPIIATHPTLRPAAAAP